MRTKKSILSVEDCAVYQSIIRELFESLCPGVAVSLACSGESALQHLRRDQASGLETQPSLVLLDIDLPGQSGFEILKQIKRDHKLRVLPVIMLSSTDREADILRSYELQASCFFRKPDNLEGLADIVRCIDRFWLRRIPALTADAFRLPSQTPIESVQL